ncbi:MAG: fructose-specific PTS transporter subunit EIIC [Clostridium sp.]|nr:fructose-specific PTS transporter subunit EIIC [Clostridium sp.]
MRITDLLNEKCININSNAITKVDIINELVELMDNNGILIDKEIYRRAIFDREELSSTGVGEGIAIPHGKTNVVVKPGLSALIIRNGVDFDSIDGLPVNLVFMIAAPDTEDNVHLKVLSRLSTLLMDKNFKEDLLNAKDKREFLKVIDEAEREKFEELKSEKEVDSGFEILAVTACPTGIAHTYMAAEAIENKAKEMGISIKVETNGSGGAKNILTPEDIEKAQCIIVAADKKVEMDRFNGKKVIEVKVSDGIYKTEELLRKAQSGDAAIYHDSSNDINKGIIEKEEGMGRQIYKHLMNGVSHMLPFVIGGGILIAVAFLFDSYEINPLNFGKNTPLAAFLRTIGEYAFRFILPVLAGYIAMSIGDRPALAIGFIGGYMADIGGSGFLGALVAGFVAGYIAVGLEKLFARLPKSLQGTKPVLLYPFFGILFIGIAMNFVINPPVAVLHNGLSNFLNSMNGSSKIFLGAILGGMMSIDFGGPINKAAYVFGTASIVTGQYDIMAAVMIGGMVPPIAIALCTIFFKSRFTERERQSGITNFIMGLAFITEGAIPFASSDPFRIIPSCAIGSSIAGALSMAFNCTLRAPHGGIFVFPLVENALMYLLSLAIGSVVAMSILAALKKPIYKNAKK